MKKIAIVLVALSALLFSSEAFAQAGLRETPAGYCYAASPSASTGLASFTGTACSVPTLPPLNFTYAVFCAYVQGVVWRDDGVAPTGAPGTGGQALNAGQCMRYNGTFSAIRFIQQASGAIVGVSLYK